MRGCSGKREVWQSMGKGRGKERLKYVIKWGGGGGGGGAGKA